MAERYTELPIVVDPIETRINQCFDSLVLSVNRRRVELLSEYREKREQRRAEEATRLRARQQLATTRAQMQEEMAENLLHSVRERMVGEVEARMRELEMTVRDVELLFQCETRELEETISRLGQLMEREVVRIPDYSNLKQPRISVCEKGIAPGQLDRVNAIAFDERTNLIYVVNNPGRICVFSEEGEYINTFGETQLKTPKGIALSGDEVFVSDAHLHTIFHFKLPDFRLVAKVGKKGAGNDHFSYPQQLTVATNGDLYVADQYNNRVAVMDCELKFKQSIQHSTMTGPKDVKLLEDKVFVLSYIDNPCLHVFSKEGNKLRSFINRGYQGNEQVRQGYYFCFDRQSNILISDYLAKSIKVFSQEGTLLHTVGESQEEERRIEPMGVVVTSNYKIICASSHTKFRLHIFY